MKVNLLPIDERPLKASAVRSGFIVSVVGILILSLALGAAVFGNMQLKQLHIQQQNTARNLDILERQRVQLDILQKSVAELQHAHQHFHSLLEAAKDRRLPEFVINAMQEIPFGLFVERAVISNGKMEIEGYTQDLGHLTRYMQKLKESSLDVSVASLLPHTPSGFTQFLIEIEAGV